MRSYGQDGEGRNGEEGVVRHLEGNEMEVFE
jgi:hypothetical protein